jgi:hypothetical protein
VEVNVSVEHGPDRRGSAPIWQSATVIFEFGEVLSSDRWRRDPAVSAKAAKLDLIRIPT